MGETAEEETTGGRGQESDEGRWKEKERRTRRKSRAGVHREEKRM